MSMFCYQCQETLMNKGCTTKGVCGKEANLSKVEDLLIYLAKSVSSYINALDKKIDIDSNIHSWVINSLFLTTTNTNFNMEILENEILKGVEYRKILKNRVDDFEIKIKKIPKEDEEREDTFKTRENMLNFAEKVGILKTEDEDIRSLKETITYALKGISSYLANSDNFSSNWKNICRFVEKTLVQIEDKKLKKENYFKLLLQCGKYGVKTMRLLNNENNKRYGEPQYTNVNTKTKKRSGILVSGDSLKDLEKVLESFKDVDIDIYTHCEMMSAHSYPYFKKHSNLIGNYGESWWNQKKDFENFNGLILLTNKYEIPKEFLENEYSNKIYLMNLLEEKKNILKEIKKYKSPKDLKIKNINTGFSLNEFLKNKDKILKSLENKEIKNFFIMGGTDARMKDREYYTDFAESLSEDTIVLTAGCAKFRYNSLDFGEINTVPRLWDVGQSSDFYSLGKIILNLKKWLGLDSINKLPVVFNIAWYDQKSIINLLSLFYLGFKNINIGPTLPAFISPHILKYLIDEYGLGTITTVREDLKRFKKHL